MVTSLTMNSRILRKGAFGNRLGIGERPALLNIDSTRMFVDPEFLQCGAKEMPEFIAAMVRITETFRSLDLPIYYSRRDDRSHPTRRVMWNLKLTNADSRLYAEDPRADEWPLEYAPRKEDVIVYKNKPFAFFGTNLASWLTAHRANLFDIDMKFGDVEKLDDVIAELKRRFKPAAHRMRAVP